MEDTDTLYAVLQVDKQATSDVINNAYRRLGLLYHPDKHLEESKKRQAQVLFNKIKRARDVLLDPHKRAVYDILGEKGLEEIEGKELAPLYSKTAREIREEYERLVKERQDLRLQQSVNPKGTLSVGLNCTDLFNRYQDSSLLNGSGLAGVEISAMTIQQSVEAPITDKDTLLISGHLSTQNGTGGGTISAVLRHITSIKGWVEVEATAGNGLATAIKGFRTLGHHSFCSLTGSLQVAQSGLLQPSLHAMYSHQLDHNLQGRLNWSFGLQNYLSTSLVWDTQFNHIGVTGQLGIPNSFVSVMYAYKFADDNGKIKVTARAGVLGAMLEYGFEKKVTQLSHVGASVVVGVPVGVSLKVKITRGNQTFVVPIHLSEQVVPSAVFYGTMLPVASFMIAKAFLLAPYLKRQKESEIKKKQEAHSERLAQRRRDAADEIQLMKATVARIVDSEEQRGGLIIVKALYGKLVSDTRAISNECVDVSIPLQCLVKNSQLTLPGNVSKMSLPGFYDPCYGVDKSLYVRYLFRNELHQVTVGDKEALNMPLQGHLITNVMR